MKEDIYPCTIISDRYNGTFSGGKWVAFNMHENELPCEIGGSDFDEAGFYQDADKKYFIGRGNTPDEAFKDLFLKTHPNYIFNTPKTTEK